MYNNDLILLKLIDSKGSTLLLRKNGLRYSQISLLIIKQQEEGNVVVTDTDIELTQKGKAYLDANLKLLSTKNNQWIIPKEYMYREPISFGTIILPKKNSI